MSGPGSRLPQHHHDGSATKADEADSTHQRSLDRATDTKKETLKAVHTAAVNNAVASQENNRVLRDRPPDISKEETTLKRKQRTTLSQLRSGHCRLLNSYRNRLEPTVSSNCPDCGGDPQDVHHLFNCTAHPNTLTPVDLWDKPAETIRELCFLDPRGWD